MIFFFPRCQRTRLERCNDVISGEYLTRIILRALLVCENKFIHSEVEKVLNVLAVKLPIPETTQKITNYSQKVLNYFCYFLRKRPQRLTVKVQPYRTLHFLLPNHLCGHHLMGVTMGRM